MHTLYRNLLSVVRRFRMATVLNVLGLAVAFAAFMAIMMQVDYERSYDRCHPGADRIFRVDLSQTGTFSTILPRGFVEAVIASSPHIEAGTLLNPFVGDVYFTVTDKAGARHGFRESVQTCLPGLIRTFDFPIVEGDADCLREPDKVIIPQSMAHRLFGDASAVGRRLHAEERIWSKNRDDDTTLLDLTVGAVYRDFPGNTQLRNVIYTAIDEACLKGNFSASNFICYLRLDRAASATDVAADFNRRFDFSNIDRPGEQITLVPLTDIYFMNESGDGRIFRSGNADVVRLLFGIALLILLIAAVNYTNFSTAMTPLRMKSINTQKVLGSTDGALRRSLLIEACAVCLVAWVVAVGIVWALSESRWLTFVEADTSPLHHPVLILLTALIALLTGLAAGLYPAYYMTSFPPALVLKGSFGLSPRGHALRNALIGMQFFTSFALIISAGFISLQNHYMQHAPLGYDRDALIVTNLSDVVKKRQSAFTDRLKANAGIAGVTYGERLLSSADFYMSWGTEFRGEDISFHVLPVDPSFLDVMGIKITEGRSFRDEDARTRHGAYVFNEMARRQFSLEPGLMIDSIEVVGFMPDVKFASFRTEVVPMAFCVWGTKNRNNFLPGYAYIKVKAGSDMRAAMHHVLATLKEFDPEYSFNVRFFDEVLQQLYEKERAVGSLITLFSAMAVFISIVGVFGLVVFDSEYRRKEIGIRKVFGSSTRQILVLFNRTYLRIVAICFVVAAPVAYYGVTRWLENFAYRTPLRWWVFVLAFIAVAAVTLATVTFQNWRAANANPVKSIRNE